MHSQNFHEFEKPFIPSPLGKHILQIQDDKRRLPDTLRKSIHGWKIGKTIGYGACSKVKLAYNPSLKQHCVIKLIPLPEIVTPRRQKYLFREAYIASALSHPNIVKCFRQVIGSNFAYYFFDFCHGVDLVDYVGQKEKISEMESRIIVRQICLALGIYYELRVNEQIDYAHNNGIVHRDIKLENIRYDPKTKVAKLIDFGFATFTEQNSALDSNCGSPCYAAPEIYARLPYYGPSVDVWSLGICIYAMTCGNLPFEGPSLRFVALNSMKITYPSFLSLDAVNLMNGMITVCKKRMTLEQVMHHLWVNITPHVNARHITKEFISIIDKKLMDSNNLLLEALDRKGALYRSVSNGCTITNANFDVKDRELSTFKTRTSKKWRTKFSRWISKLKRSKPFQNIKNVDELDVALSA